MTVPPSPTPQLHGHAGYRAVISILVLLVLVLGATAGYLYVSRPGSVSQTSNLNNQKVNTTVHTNPIPLQVFDITVVTPRAFVWNFTVDFTGKDAGSETFTLVIDYAGAQLVLLMSEKNLTDWLSSPLTVHSGQRLAFSAFTNPSPICAGTSPSPICTGTVTLNFRPPASGSYHLVFVPYGFLGTVPGVQTLHIEVHGLQTWTTTTIGRG